MFLTYGNLSVYRLFVHRIELGIPFSEYLGTGGSRTYAPASAAPAGAMRRGVAFYAARHAGYGLEAIHAWQDGDGGHRYAARSPGPSYRDAGVAFYAVTQPSRGVAPVHRWEDPEDASQVVYSTFDLEGRGYRRAEVAFYTPTLAEQQFFDPDGGYVYWVHIRGKHDFNCCYSAQNPTRQTDQDHADFALRTDPHPDGYEAVVCSPTCGTGGRIVWQGPVEFEPNAKEGRLRISPDGPRRDFR